MSYDQNNIFSKILKGEIPSTPIFENEYVLAFNDIEPKAPNHIIIIPKGSYTDSFDFYKNGNDLEIIEFERAIAKIAEDLNIDKTGYRLISNCGRDSGQEVPHYHVHMLAGKKLGPILG